MADISYTRTTWADGSEGGTPIDAAKLNNIEQGVVDAVAAIGPNDTTEDGTLKAQIDQNASDISDLQDSVHQKTATVTTTEAGYGYLGLSASSYDVISCHDSAGYACIPFVLDNEWCALVVDFRRSYDYPLVQKNKSVSFTVRYCDK